MNNIKLKTFIDNGQKFYEVTSEKWKKIKKIGKYDGVKFQEYLLQEIEEEVLFSEKYPDMKYTLLKTGIKSSKEGEFIRCFWLPVIFINVEGIWQRTFLERVQCKKCQLFSNIANPSFSELYIFLPNKFELLRQAWELPHKNCPNCNEKFERLAIWAELDEKL